MPSVIFKSFKIQRTISVSQTYSVAQVEAVQRGSLRCTACGSEDLIHYDSYKRRIKHISDNGAKYLLVVRYKRYKCKHCGKVFRQELEGIRKNGNRLEAQKLERLEKFFENNPAIKLAYEFKERLCELLNRKHQTAKECMRNIKELKTMMKQMKYEATQEFERLAETIGDWFAPIIRMWRYTKNNGITEGFHRKMKLIQRMAYGYRNFENYRLRVLVLCGVFH